MLLFEIYIIKDGVGIERKLVKLCFKIFQVVVHQRGLIFPFACEPFDSLDA